MQRTIGPGEWLRSVPTAAADLLAGRTHCYPTHLGQRLTMTDGRAYVPFRHTRKDEVQWSTDSSPAVLHPRFRLRFFAPRRRRLHALFRAVCIVTTPFFVGLRGFRSKLWMVDPATGDFAGLYEWDDEPTARAYAQGLSKVLRMLSVKESVSYELRSGTVEDYLAEPRRAA